MFSKVWEFHSNCNLVTIVHAGKHTCVPIEEKIRPDYRKYSSKILICRQDKLLINLQ